MSYPMIFSAHSISKLLEGSKTQTRRVVNFPKTFRDKSGTYHLPLELWESTTIGGNGTFRIARSGRVHVPEEVAMWNPKGATCIGCPYQPGDTIWTKEAWFQGYATAYAADYPAEKPPSNNPTDRWRSPRYMPRWASRISLQITQVRVQRLQDISEEDIEAEGIWIPRWGCPDCDAVEPERKEFARLWNSLNAKREGGKYAWDKNPWVWAISFRKV